MTSFILHSMREKCPYSELFWPGEIRSIHIQSECGKILTRITPNTETFYAVHSNNIFSKKLNNHRHMNYYRIESKNAFKTHFKY